MHPLDSIVVFKSTRFWLHQRNLLPSKWEIRPDKHARILASSVGITVYNTPASCLPVSELIRRSIQFLVVFDPSLYDTNVLTARQQIASFLHEIGHIVNPPRKESIDIDGTMKAVGLMECEVYADDYARYCGYGADFAEALEAMQVHSPKTFSGTAIDRRIQRIRTDPGNANLYLNLKEG